MQAASRLIALAFVLAAALPASAQTKPTVQGAQTFIKMLVEEGSLAVSPSGKKTLVSEVAFGDCTVTFKGADGRSAEINWRKIAGFRRPYDGSFIEVVSGAGELTVWATTNDLAARALYAMTFLKASCDTKGSTGF